MANGYIGIFQTPQEGVVVDDVSPESPTNVLLGSGGRNTISDKLAISGYITVGWEHNAPPDLDRYEVALCESGETPEKVDILICSKESGRTAKFDKPAYDTVKFDGSSSSVKIDGLKPNTTYFAAVRAVDANGNKSNWSYSSPLSTGSEQTAVASSLTVRNLYRGLALNWTNNGYTDYVNILFDGSGATSNHYINKQQGDEVFAKLEEEATYSGIVITPFNVEGTAGSNLTSSIGWAVKTLYTDDANYSGISDIAVVNDGDLDTVMTARGGNGIQADIIRNNGDTGSLFNASDQMTDVDAILNGDGTVFDITNALIRHPGSTKVLFDIENMTINDGATTLIDLDNAKIQGNIYNADGTNLLIDTTNKVIKSAYTGNTLFDLNPASGVEAEMTGDLHVTGNLIVGSGLEGQRIEIDGINNDLTFYNSSNEILIKMDDAIFGSDPGLIIDSGYLYVVDDIDAPSNWTKLGVGELYSRNLDGLQDRTVKGYNYYSASTLNSYGVYGIAQDSTTNTYAKNRIGIGAEGVVTNASNTSIPIGIYGQAITSNATIQAIGGRFDCDDIVLQLRNRSTPTDLCNFTVDSSGYLTVDASGDRVIMPDDIINDDIVYPKIGLTGDEQTAIITIDCSDFADAVSGRIAANLRGFITWWFSTSSDHGDPSFITGASAYSIGAVNNGNILEPASGSLTAMNQAVTDSSGIFEFTVTSGNDGGESIVYFYAEIQGITRRLLVTLFDELA